MLYISKLVEQVRDMTRHQNCATRQRHHMHGIHHEKLTFETRHCLSQSLRNFNVTQTVYKRNIFTLIKKSKERPLWNCCQVAGCSTVFYFILLIVIIIY